MASPDASSSSCSDNEDGDIVAATRIRRSRVASNANANDSSSNNNGDIAAIHDDVVDEEDAAAAVVSTIDAASADGGQMLATTARRQAAKKQQHQGTAQHQLWASRVYNTAAVAAGGLPSTGVDAAAGSRTAVRGFHDASRSGGSSHQQQQQQQQHRLPFQCPAVVPLNVGGVCYITRRNTLLKEADSMLAAMFSGRHEMQKDKHGYYFIDSNGAYFGYILDYLRHGKLPPNDAALPVYQEAGYFGLAGLQEALAMTPSVARELVRRRHEDQFPDYGRLRGRLIAAAMELAVATRCADLVVWPHKGQATPQHSSCVAETAHVKVGPWAGPADEDTLMRTLHADLTEAGFSLAPLEKKRCKFFVSGQTCTRLAYKLAFKFI